jgi:hypothetical protein
VVSALALFLIAVSSPAARESRGDALAFPADANLVNVRDFGVVGDGRHDDTAALQSAFDHALLAPPGKPGHFNVTVLIPAGTYLISDTIDYGKQPGWAKRIQVQGEGSGSTIIRLKDRAEKFQSGEAPRPVLSTFSGSATNQAFLTQINDLAIDVGTGNPGANGLHFLANNVGGLRNVRIVSSDPAGIGAIGLDLNGAWVGPALFEGVVIRGFDTGISTLSGQYGATFKDLTLEHQRQVGILNRRDSLAIDGLVSRNAVPAINNTVAGFIALVRGRLDGIDHTDQPGIINDGVASLHLVDTTITGYPPGTTDDKTLTFGSDAPASLVVTGGKRQSDFPKFTLPDPKFPTPPAEPVERWARVDDLTGEAIQRALDSGRSTVYLPTGRYMLSAPLTVPPGVRRVIGFISQLKLEKTFPAGVPVVTIDPKRRDSLVIERFDMWSGAPPDTVWIANDSTADVMISDSVLDGVAYRGRGDGTEAPGAIHVFFKNVGGIRQMEFDHQNAVAWQLNPESRVDKIANIGSHLTIYGLKTEGPGALVTNDHGETTVFGGLNLVNFDVPADVPMFEVNHGRTCISMVEITNNPKDRGYTRYTTLLGSKNDHAQFRMATDFPERGGTGRVYPAVCAP